MVETILQRLNRFKKNGNSVNVLAGITPSLTLTGVKVVEVCEDYVVFSDGTTSTVVPYHSLKYVEY